MEQVTMRAAGGDLDSGQQGDFLEEAHKLFESGQATSMVEAMRKIRRDRPELHEAFKEKSLAEDEIIFGKFKANEAFVKLRNLYRLALAQAERAKAKGYPKLAQGVMNESHNILNRMKKLIREGQISAGKR